MTPTQPDPLLAQQIAQFIRAGGYPHLAAEAVGISRETFEQWLEQGRQQDAPEHYRLFAHEIMQAMAQARIAAENRTFDKDPATWLRSGPGKETPGNPGWTTPGKPQEIDNDMSLLIHEQFQDLLTELMTLLQPYPEIRAMVADAFSLPGD